MIQDYRVLRAFEAVEAISGHPRRFERGDVVTCDAGETDPTGPILMMIEADTSLYLVDRSTFDACCEFKSPGNGGV